MTGTVAGEPTDAQALIRRDLCRLARFGANISDAYSCFVFLPAHIFAAADVLSAQRILQLVGHHSLAREVNLNCKISSDSGLIGWVATHGRSIHVSPFEHDSRTLGVYPTDQGLKSFIGIPISLPLLVPPDGRGDGSALSGVIACDSKKSFAFSKLQGKLLEELSWEVANTLKLILCALNRPGERYTWAEFMARGRQFLSALGAQSVDVLRMKLVNFERTEQIIGSGRAVEVVEQAYRLALQAVPPHLPHFRFPTGDVVFLVDNMMTSFYENKIRAVCSRILADAAGLSFVFVREAAKSKRAKNVNIERLISDSCAISLEAPPALPQKLAGISRREAGNARYS